MKPNAEVRAGSTTRGLTLTEVIVSILVFGVVVTGALGFVQVQSRGFGQSLDQMSVAQTLRIAMRSLEDGILTAGTDLEPGHPGVVLAGEEIFAFKTRHAPSLIADPGDSEDSGLLGHPLKVTFFFSPDPETPRKDDFALFRQLDAEEPVVLAKNLLRLPGRPFFRFLTVTDLNIDSIPSSQLPMASRTPGHPKELDREAGAALGRIRGVRVTLGATNGEEGERERTSVLTRLVQAPNLRFSGVGACGRKPVFTSELSGSLTTNETGRTVVDLKWERSPDDGEGENDILRYVLWRRAAGSPGWGTPFLSIPAGKETYTYQDGDVQPGLVYEYGISAQDCGPAGSPAVTSRPVAVSGL
jgi:prepilin-type N-terminal cleavage/methylation domain-containing protein